MPGSLNVTRNKIFADCCPTKKFSFPQNITEKALKTDHTLHERFSLSILYYRRWGWRRKQGEEEEAGGGSGGGCDDAISTFLTFLPTDIKRHNAWNTCKGITTCTWNTFACIKTCLHCSLSCKWDYVLTTCSIHYRRLTILTTAVESYVTSPASACYKNHTVIHEATF